MFKIKVSLKLRLLNRHHCRHARHFLRTQFVKKLKEAKNKNNLKI